MRTKLLKKLRKEVSQYYEMRKIKVSNTTTGYCHDETNYEFVIDAINGKRISMHKTQALCRKAFNELWHHECEYYLMQYKNKRSKRVNKKRSYIW